MFVTGAGVTTDEGKLVLFQVLGADFNADGDALTTC
jgi:hypothetical protein